MPIDNNEDLKQFIIDVIEENFGPTPTEIAAKWNGGKIIIEASGDQQPKEIPMDVFFKKLLSVRDSIRVLEQKINTSKSLDTAEKATIHGYISKCYGSLTTFNIMFKENKDKFVGAGKTPASKGEKLTMSEAKAKLGLNEY